MKKGDHVLYIPTHAAGDRNHPDVERGIVTGPSGWDGEAISVHVRFTARPHQPIMACYVRDLVLVGSARPDCARDEYGPTPGTDPGAVHCSEGKLTEVPRLILDAASRAILRVGVMLCPACLERNKLRKANLARVIDAPEPVYADGDVVTGEGPNGDENDPVALSRQIIQLRTQIVGLEATVLELQAVNRDLRKALLAPET